MIVYHSYPRLNATMGGSLGQLKKRVFAIDEFAWWNLPSLKVRFAPLAAQCLHRHGSTVSPLFAGATRTCCPTVARVGRLALAL